MRKEISYSQFQQVKSAAKMIDPNMRKIEALKKKIMPLVEEMKQYQALNDSLEAGIVSVIGFHVTDLVKKVIEPTGAAGKDGKPIKVTKYLPTDIVSYDEQHKVYVIETKDAPAIEAPTTSEEAADFHSKEVGAEVSEVVDAAADEQEAEGNGMSLENN